MLQYLAFCTAVPGWVALSVAGYALYWHRHKTKKFVFIMPIVAVLWGVTSFNTWYEAAFLSRNISLLSVPNGWAFTLITPLLYLCCRFCSTGCYPDSKQWTRHLFIPGILLVVYVGMSLWGSVPDKRMDNWQELCYNLYTWAVLFRMSCYLLLVVQLCVYLTRLPVKREHWFILSLYAILIACMFTSSLVCNILYNLSLFLLSVYFVTQTLLYRLLQRRLKPYLLPEFIIRRFPTASVKEKELTSVFTSEREEQVKQLLSSSEFLHNPDLKIGMLARELCTNITYTRLYFKQKLGVSFNQYITSCRLDEAERLLRDTDASIIEISEQVGFRHYSTFAAAFKARHAMSPMQWKNEL